MIAAATYYLHDLSPFFLRFGEGAFGLRWYGLSYVAAFLAGYMIYLALSRKGCADLPINQVGDFMTWWVVLGTIIGGRLGYMVFYDLDGFLSNPLSVFKVWEGGMSAHGGMIGLVAATLIYSRVHHISWTNLGDNLVVVAPVGLFFGRLANFINGELYGRPSNVFWAVQFPKELHGDPAMATTALRNAGAVSPGLDSVERIIDTVPHSAALREMLAEILTPRHPSQLYEAALEGLLLFVVLWILRTRFRLPNGVLTGLFFIGYAVLRSACEFFREPDSPLLYNLTRGQFLSVFLFLIGLAFVAAAVLRPVYPEKLAREWGFSPPAER